MEWDDTIDPDWSYWDRDRRDEYHERLDAWLASPEMNPHIWYISPDGYICVGCGLVQPREPGYPLDDAACPKRRFDDTDETE